MSLAKQGKRNIPTFNEAGATNGNTNNGTDVSTDVNTNPDTTSENDHNTVPNPFTDLVHSLTEVPPPIKRKQLSVYIDEDIYKAFEKYGKKYGKGSKSDLINNFLMKALQVNR